MPVNDQPLVINFNPRQDNVFKVFESQFLQLEMVLVVLEGKNRQYSEY